MGFDRKTHIFTLGSAALAKCLGMPEFRAHVPGPGAELEHVPGALPSLEEVMGCSGVALGCCMHLRLFLTERGKLFLDTAMAGRGGLETFPGIPNVAV